MHFNRNDDSIVALSTPSGPGAIGVIRLSGPDSIRIVDTVFSKDIADASGYSVHFGQILKPDKQILDEVLVTVFRGPRSYTREDVVEISFHGSAYILEQALHLFANHGARPALPGEFTQRAFLNGSMDLSQAEAVADLIASDSAKAHEIALRQMRGGVSDEIVKLRTELLDLTSLFELELDFGEEDVEFADREKLISLIREIKTLTTRLAETFRLGNAIKEGIATVIAGRPNAGKSTLLNALLQEERAIVSDIPGTTRDTIEESLVIEGVRFRLVDTAGIREAEDQIEAIGVERTMEKIGTASVLLYIYDGPGLNPAEVLADLEKLQRPGLQILPVANKIDLLDQGNDKQKQSLHSGFPDGHLLISALTHQDLDLLKQRLVNLALGDQLLTGQDVIISNARHYQALRQAAGSLGEAEAALLAGLSQELVAIDIRHAIHHLGSITGEITTDEVLGNIFGKFCIGK